MTNIQNNFTEWIKADNFRKHLFTTILIFIALFLIVETVLTYKKAIDYKNTTNLNYITATGKAEEYIKPDTLTFNILVNEDGKDVVEATKKVADKVNKAVNILKANGVEENNIKLQSYNIQDKYENVSTPCRYGNIQPMIPVTGVVKSFAPISNCQTTNSKIVGQTITQSIEVKIRDIEKNADNDKRTKIINDLTAQNIKADNFTFTVFNIDNIKKGIRDRAIKDAKEDAKRLAKELGVKLDELTSFSENGGGYNPYVSARATDMYESKAASPVAPELPTGQEKIISNVSLTYSIK